MVEVYVAMIGMYAMFSVKSEYAANEQALIDAEDEICSLEVMLEEERRADRNTVQPSSHAALRNAKRAVGALRDMDPFSYLLGSTNRRTALLEKVIILGSHKAYYKATQRQQRAATPVTATNVPIHLAEPVKNLPILDNNDDDDDDGSVGDAVALLSPTPAAVGDYITRLTGICSEIRKLMQLHWYCNTEASKALLKIKQVELATAFENLDETQRLDWLLHLA